MYLFNESAEDVPLLNRRSAQRIKDSLPPFSFFVSAREISPICLILQQNRQIEKLMVFYSMFYQLQNQFSIFFIDLNMKILTTNFLSQLKRFALNFVLTLFFLIVITQTSTAQNNRWEYIGTNASGIVFYIDKTSIERSGREVSLWEKSVFSDGSYQINLSRWKCSERTNTLIISNIYTPQGRLIDRKDGKNWNSIIPESIGEMIYETVCSTNTSKTTTAEMMTKNVQVISKLANIRKLPSMNAAVVKKAVKGTVFRLVEAEPESGWYQIYIDKDQTAWVHGNTIEFIFLVPKNSNNKAKLPPSLLNSSEERQN